MTVTLPKHQNPTQDHARAPYNFVPLPEQILVIDPQTLPDQNRYHPDRHTGRIDCIITTETPIFVRAPLTLEEFERQEVGQDNKMPWRQQVRNKPDFFYTDPAKTPCIPGSSLRGMLRQLVEIISYSKVQWVSHQPLVYRAVGDTTSHGNRYRSRIMRYDEQTSFNGKRAMRYTPLVKAGYIEEDDGKYFIRPAREIDGTTFARIPKQKIPHGLKQWRNCKNAFEIWFQPDQYDYKPVRGGFLHIKYAKVIRAAAQSNQGWVWGVLVCSGPMESKRSEAVIYPPDEQAARIEIPDELVIAYKDQVTQEQENLLGTGGVLRNDQPVFYLMDKDKLVFFGHTMMMRLPYLHTPINFVPEKLRRESDLDLAEAIFGYTKSTGEGKARAYASRVFVGDALLDPGQSNIWLSTEPIVPKILASPKPTTFQHYLTQTHPDPQLQRSRNGKPKQVKELADYTDYGESVIRGYKLYWHKGSVTLGDLQEDLSRLCDTNNREKEYDTQHTQMRPVAPQVRFRWCISFENLSNEELGALLWALTLPGESGKEYRHSIGMGKPFGMGAIKIEVNLMLNDRQKRYATLFDDTTWLTGDIPANDRIPEFVASFDQFVREKIGETNVTSLNQVERIQMLLCMLEWPGPDKDKTRYMEIERQVGGNQKVNEYKNRPVLPDPLWVACKPAARKQEVRGVESAVRSEKETVLSNPSSVDEIKPGMYLEGRVVRVEEDRVVISILGIEASLVRNRIDPPVRDVAEMKQRFPVGEVVRARVTGFNKNNRLQLTQKP